MRGAGPWIKKDREMSETPIIIQDPVGSRDNEIRPFQIEGQNVRGRAVRLGTALEEMMAVHDWPEPVAQIMGELTALTALLGSVMKHEGVVTIQTKSKGALPMLVVDYRVRDGEPGTMRGYAQIDETALSHYGKNPSFKGLIGSKSGGFLVITVDQGAHTERFQGIVDLSGDTLSEVAVNYFSQSEQTPTAMRLAAGRDPVTGHWRAGGIMVQHLARGEEGQERLLEASGDDEWERARILMESVKTEELLDPTLTLDALLFRLYHEDGVRVFDPFHATFGCSGGCEDRIQSTISRFSADDIDHMTVDGSITVDCHFCGKSFVFDPEQLKADT